MEALVSTVIAALAACGVYLILRARTFAVVLGLSLLSYAINLEHIGDIVTNAVVGSRFGWSLAWVVVVGVAGICVFAQMSGKVAAVSGRATVEVIRERLFGQRRPSDLSDL